MRYSKEHKAETRAKILKAALNKFRSEGYGGIGIDGITKAAGVTSGAFYTHFGSKADAFRGTVVEGLEQLRTAIENNRDEGNKDWLANFATWYLSLPKARSKPDPDCLLPMQGGCALPTLTPEVVRAGKETQSAYQQEIKEIINAINLGLSDEVKNKQQFSWSMLAMLIGGVTLARSVRDRKVAAEISDAILQSINDLQNK